MLGDWTGFLSELEIASAFLSFRSQLLPGQHDAGPDAPIFINIWKSLLKRVRITYLFYKQLYWTIQLQLAGMQLGVVSIVHLKSGSKAVDLQ